MKASGQLGGTIEARTRIIAMEMIKQSNSEYRVKELEYGWIDGWTDGW